MYKQLTVDIPRPVPAPEFDSNLLEILPMVRYLARRIQSRLPRTVDFDDLLSAGMVGLMEASAKFNPAKNIKFSSYAQFRVRGAILDSLRVSDWAPRHLRQKGRAVKEAIRTLTSRLGHAPMEDEIAKELKIDLNEYQILLGDLNSLEMVSLHRKRDEESGEEDVIPIQAKPEDDPLFRCIRGQMGERLTLAIEELSERERLVTTLYYYEELTLREIGLAMGLDPTRVSQIRGSAVSHLRAALSKLLPKVAEIPTHILAVVVKMPAVAMRARPVALAAA
jgi:RNA polymerase sigma factor FliA